MPEQIFIPTNGAKDARRWTKEEVDTAVALRKEGKNDKEIGEAIGRSELSVQAKFWRMANVRSEIKTTN